jgi:hypothetical protein
MGVGILGFVWRDRAQMQVVVEIAIACRGKFLGKSPNILPQPSFVLIDG